jgi:dihydrodipicolinate synthase/N-acetylneuraminate lyase
VDLKVGVVLKGTLAAAVTPLRDGGLHLDESGFAPLVDFLAAGGLDGIFALGTTGEGILLAGDERRRAAELFVRASEGRLAIAVHCGAQTTADTAALAAHAAEAGAEAVAVIAPPYFRLDDEALLEHFAAAAGACAPLPFYLYELATASGYAIPIPVVERLRARAPNLAGLKVSDAPWESFAPYLIEGLDVFVGPESLIERGLEAGAVGAVSALATAFPERVAKRDGDLGTLRAGIERFPRHAALKRVLGRRGVAVGEDVRAPLRGLTDAERKELDAWLESL